MRLSQNWRMGQAVRSWGRVNLGHGLAILALALSACTTLARDFGYAPDDQMLNEIVVGVDSAGRVEEVLGRPGHAGLVQDRAWYYISSRQETYLWTAPRITERSVVAISFDEAGTVQNIERLTVEDGREVAFSRRVTDENTVGIGFLRQLLGNVGRVGTDTLAGGGGDLGL